MALIKNIDSGFGIPAKYWKIATSNADFVAGTLDVTLHGYATPEARVANCEPLVKTGVSLHALDTADRASLYALIKATPEFQESTDA